MPIVVDPTGVTVPSLPQAADEELAAVRAVFGTDTSTAAQTPQTQIAGILAVALNDYAETLTGLHNSVSLHHSTGSELDTLGEHLGIARAPARRSVTSATVTGVAGTTVPASSRARSSNGDEFETVTDVVLSAAGVTVELQAVETGPVEAAAGTITRIVTVVAGWETVTNPTAATIGAAAEPDGDYRQALLERTARNAVGPMSAIDAALSEALAGQRHIIENAQSTLATVQGYPILGHSILVIANSGSDSDLLRAVENHKGMCVATTVGIVGGTTDTSALDAVSDGTVTWNGTAYTGLDLTSAGTDSAKAAALTTLLAADPAPSTVVAYDGAYLAVFAWHPDRTPVFGDGTVETAYGLNPDDVASAPPGPFTRPRARPLTITAAVTRASAFPADGLARLRDAVTAVIVNYGLGEQVWSNDILAAMEGVPGTRVTALSVQHDSVDVSGVEPPLDAHWTLPTANLTITIT